MPHPTAPKVRLSLAGEIFLTILAAIIAFIVLRSFFSLPVTVLSILSYATLCYAVYLAWGDRKGISFWALCIPAYNIRRFMRAQGTHGDSAGGPNNDEEIHVVFDSGPWQGSELQLRNQQTIFGRDPSAHLRLENLQVSRRHVALSLDESPTAAIVVADLGSSNGTWFAQALDEGTWSAWQKISDEIRIPLNARHRYQIRLGEDGDQFHFE